MGPVNIKNIPAIPKISRIAATIRTLRRTYTNFTSATITHYHFTLFAQYAADILPFAIFLRCRALNDARFFFILSLSPAFGFPAVLAPC